MHWLIAPLALLVERLFGYPTRLTDLIGHPVIWFGRLIGWLDTKLNTNLRSDRARRYAGILTLAIVLVAVLIGSLLILQLTRRIPHFWVLEAILATSLLAQKELGRAVRAVAEALDISLDAGREAVSHIVGRDPKVLDQAGVSRAAIETLAENASDAVIAPLFWLFLFGLPGIALYKAINTADSMIGHLDDRYRDFGWASAKLDDVVNLIPARLTAGLFVAAAFVLRNASPTSALTAARRDAKKHNSPNAGWPEAALAGALGFALGGPRSYEGKVLDLPVMGDCRTDLGPEDIRQSLALYRTMLNITLVLSILLGLLLAF